MAASEVAEPRTGTERHAWRRAWWPALWLVGLAAGGWLLALGLTDERAAGHRVTAVLATVVGWSFVASGLIAWRRRPTNRLGPLMLVLGLTWLAGYLMIFSGSAIVFTAGVWVRDAWVVPFVLFLLAFPEGRVDSRAAMGLVAAFAFTAGPLELAWLLFWDPGRPPDNALLAWPDDAAASAIDWVQRVIFVGGSFVLTAVLATRWWRASPPLRRGLTPLLAGGVALLISNASLGISKLTGTDPPDLIQTAQLIALITVAVGVLVDMLRARLARLAVGDLVLELRRNPDPGDLRAALARALGDPSLELAYWLPEYSTYATLDGHPLELPADSRRVTHMVDRNGGPVAALVHDPSLREEPALLDSVGAAAGIALENARLHSELLARLEELRGAGTRVVEAMQSERRRLERDLHDGAQPRRVALSRELGLRESRRGDDSESRHAVAQARHELTRSLDELRELARGIHPAVLTGHGLEVALESLAARAPVPVRVSVRLDSRLPEPVEVAAYFLVSEGLTNVAKYARASVASVEIARDNGIVVVEVADDGVGGADAAAGSGLRGLTDRVEALGGHLRVTSVVGQGTCMRAEIPCT